MNHAQTLTKRAPLVNQVRLVLTGAQPALEKLIAKVVQEANN